MCHKYQIRRIHPKVIGDLHILYKPCKRHSEVEYSAHPAIIIPILKWLTSWSFFFKKIRKLYKFFKEVYHLHRILTFGSFLKRDQPQRSEHSCELYTVYKLSVNGKYGLCGISMETEEHCLSLR